MSQGVLAAVELSSLLESILPASLNKLIPKLKVSALALHSSEINSGTAFIALRGERMNGKAFIDDAVGRGAPVVLAEAEDNDYYLSACQIGGLSAPVFHIPALRCKVGHIAANFYGTPSQDLALMGITGTNGKTSTAYITAHAIQKLVGRCGLIGTLGAGVIGEENIRKTANTTPDAISIQRVLRDFKQLNSRHAVMEVSSHALEQDRIQGCRIKSAVFTNLTRDHLDYHVSMEAYGRAKAKLFSWPELQNAVINIDDDFGLQLAKTAKVSEAVITLSTKSMNTSSHDANIFLKNLDISPLGMSFDLSSPWGEVRINASLMGRFNLYNLMSSFALLMLEGFSIKEVAAALEQVPPVPGRMQALGGQDKPRVVIDYAHTPDALSLALQALKEHCQQKLTCVFGCGGDRDKGKRALMGEIASSFADKLIITDDNPRTEDSKQIVKDILAGISSGAEVSVIHDRKTAISEAITSANKKDVVLVAGKGHEEYQQIGAECYPFNDATEAKLALERLV